MNERITYRLLTASPPVSVMSTLLLALRCAYLVRSSLLLSEAGSSFGSHRLLNTYSSMGSINIARPPGVHTASTEISTTRGSRNLRSLLRSYKTDHASSRFPPNIYSNTSPDTRLWTKDPLTSDPLVWHNYQAGLGYHLLRHPSSASRRPCLSPSAQSFP